MDWKRCREYNAKEETEGGAYWELLTQDNDEFRKNALVYYLAEIIKKIQNKELKQKIKAKVIEVYGHNSLYEMERFIVVGGYPEEEIKEFVGEGLENIKSKFANKESSQKEKPVDYRVLTIIQHVDDAEWQKAKIDELLKFVVDNTHLYSDETIKEIITYMIFNIKNKNIQSEMLEKYSENVWEELKKYIDFENDENYILKKAEKFKDVRIGLNPKLKIGLEIEANRALFKGGLTYGKKGLEKFWHAVDMTVADGAEFVTPIFHDVPNEFSVICAFCETIKEIGFEYDESLRNASGQINIGIDYLDTAEAILNFYEIYGNVEELLFYISNEEGQVIRKNIYENKYMKPFSGGIGNLEIDEEITRDDVIRMFTSIEDYTTLEFLDDIEDAKYIRMADMREERPKAKSIPVFEFKKNTVCLRRANRLEFRIPNGSVNYEVWRDNIRLYGRIVEVAKETADIFKNGIRNERDLEKLSLKEELKVEEKTLEEKLFVLMDLLFEDNEIKKIYMDRFYTLQNKIKQENLQEYTRPIESKSNGFGVVDFQKMYRCRVYENRGPITIYEPRNLKNNEKEI